MINTGQKFKVGDRVRVISKPPKDTKIHPVWVGRMDGLCGKEFVVASAPNFVKGLGWEWNDKWLEKADEKVARPTKKKRWDWLKRIFTG